MRHLVLENADDATEVAKIGLILPDVALFG